LWGGKFDELGKKTANSASRLSLKKKSGEVGGCQNRRFSISKRGEAAGRRGEGGTRRGDTGLTKGKVLSNASLGLWSIGIRKKTTERRSRRQK